MSMRGLAHIWAQEEDVRTFEALSAPLYAQVQRAIASRDSAAAAAAAEYG